MASRNPTYQRFFGALFRAGLAAPLLARGGAGLLLEAFAAFLTAGLVDFPAGFFPAGLAVADLAGVLPNGAREGDFEPAFATTDLLGARLLAGLIASLDSVLGPA